MIWESKLYEGSQRNLVEISSFLRKNAFKPKCDGPKINANSRIVQSQELCKFIHHEPTFHLRVKNQRLISFFSLHSSQFDQNFEQFLFCFNNTCFLVLLSPTIDGFWKQKTTNSAWGKKEIQFLWRENSNFSLTWVTSYGL